MLVGAGSGLGTMGQDQVEALKAVTDSVGVSHPAYDHAGGFDAMGDVVEPGGNSR